MSAFFGIDERKARGFVDQNMVCFPYTSDGELDKHSIVSPIRTDDIVFIKHCTPQQELHIKAVGVVKSDYPGKSEGGECLPVEWVWQGEKVSENLEEALPLCGEALYEEHNIVVQREIIDLLPPRYQLPQTGY